MPPDAFTHLLALLVLLSRVGDIASTRLVTPRLTLEANALVRRFGWPFGYATLLLAVVPYASPPAGIAILTASLFVTAANLSRGWFGRALGEDEYYALLLRVARRSRRRDALAFTAAAAALLALSGLFLMGVSGGATTAAFWFGVGIVAYALAIAIHGSTFIVRVFRQASGAEPSRDPGGRRP